MMNKVDSYIFLRVILMVWNIKNIKLTETPRVLNGRSKLASKLKDIQELRSSGYTLSQIRKFLLDDGIEITISGLSSYLKRKSININRLNISELEVQPKPMEEPMVKKETKLPLSLSKSRNVDINLDDYKD